MATKLLEFDLFLNVSLRVGLPNQSQAEPTNWKNGKAHESH
jgi:hypothetical protein